ncbi:MAG: phosphotransferase [Myxococcota bacterium]
MSRRLASVPLALRRWLAHWRLTPDAAHGPVLGARHPGLVCRDGRQRVYLKVSVLGDPGVDAEAEALAALQRAEISGVPRVVRHAPGALAVEWLAGRTLYAHRRLRGEHVERQVGTALARVHHGARDLLPGRLVSGELISRLVWTTPELYAALGPAELELFRKVQADARATERLVWLLDTETPEASAFVHGDLRQPNVLVGRRGVAFLDWEQSGQGDPARDLGMLLADDFAAWVAPRDAEERLHFPALRANARALVSGWERETGRLRRARPKALRTRVICWMAEALLRRVFTLAHHEGALGTHGAWVLDAALALLHTPAAQARRLLGGVA